MSGVLARAYIPLFQVVIPRAPALSLGLPRRKPRGSVGPTSRGRSSIHRAAGGYLEHEWKSRVRNEPRRLTLPGESSAHPLRLPENGIMVVQCLLSTLRRYQFFVLI